MNAASDVVIIGGGLAGAQTAKALRKAGHTGAITLIAAEDHLPYERPPLSKKYLAGKVGFDVATVNSAAWYDEQDVDLRRGSTATAIDRDRREVHLEDGTVVPYDRLVLATGSQPRKLTMAGAESPNVHYLRTVEDSDAIRATFGSGKALAIIGAGWIGLEVAAAARAADTAVTILERSDVPLQNVLGPEIGQVFADVHRNQGVDLRTGTEIAELVTDSGVVTGVRLAEGTVIPVDAVVVGIGVTPVVSLAQDAGLDVDDGVLVDASLRTSDPNILAIGDIANHDHPVLGHRVRVEHWATALRQPKTAAAVIDGAQAEFTRLPYFFSDQYDLGMEYIGYTTSDSYAQVHIRGDVAARKFLAFWLSHEDRILAAMTVNVWDVLDEIEPLIAEGTVVDVAKLIDPNVPYAELA